MNDKTFKANASTSDNRVLEVKSWHDGPILTGDVSVIVRIPAGKGRGIVIQEADAPALALAILEAAGVGPKQHNKLTYGTPEHLEGIAQQLGRYIEQRDLAADRKAKEAADREALEGEALAFANAYQEAHGYDLMEVMNKHCHAYKEWMAVARKARELHGGTK